MNRLQLYPFLPTNTSGNSTTTAAPDNEPGPRHTIKIDSHDWASAGSAILAQYLIEESGTYIPKPGEAIALAFETADVAPQSSVVLSDEHNGHEVEAPLEVVNDKPAETVPVQTDNLPADTASTSTQHADVVFATPIKSSANVPVENQEASTSRKRSVDAADLAEPVEGSRVRSKRIRARESIAGDNNNSEMNGLEATANQDEKIQISAHYDQWLFTTLTELTEKMDLNIFIPAPDLRNVIKPTSDTEGNVAHEVPLAQAMKDFYEAMNTWNDEKTSLFIRPDADGVAEDYEQAQLELSDSTSRVEKLANLDSPEPDLIAFVNIMNQGWSSTIEVAVQWVCMLLRRDASTDTNDRDVDRSSSYSSSTWPDALHDVVRQAIIDLDTFLYTTCSEFCDVSRLPSLESNEGSLVDREDTIEMMQSLFELHLDIRARMDASTDTPDEAKIAQQARLEKWSNLAVQAINTLPRDEYGQIQDRKMCIRHMWASVFRLQYGTTVDREHIITCLEDLKITISSGEYQEVLLPNNSAMPELSVRVVEHELSKLQTVDFFSGIFTKGEKNPVDLIERLEPILMRNGDKQESFDAEANDMKVEGQDHIGDDIPSSQSQQSQKASSSDILVAFVEKSGLPLILSLWQKLRDAYMLIDVPAKVVFINFQCMKLIMDEFKSSAYCSLLWTERLAALLGRLAKLEDLLNKTMVPLSENSDVLEYFDQEQLHIYSKTLADVITLMYTVSLYDDYSQIGQKGPLLMNPFRAYPSESFHTTAIKFHDMQVKLWILLYKILSQLMKHTPEVFPEAWTDQIDYLRHVHYMLGVRRLCKASDSLFLRFMKDEILLQPQLNQRSSDELAQVLYDIYDLHCFSSIMERNDHGCEADYLDRKTALGLVDFVLDKAQKSTIKDLLKSDLGKTVEKVHNALGTSRGSPSMIRNKRVFTAYMKSPIDPVHLYRCLQGVGQISTVSVMAEESMVASKGWYFLKGQLALARYRAQKARGSPGPTSTLR